MKALLVNQYAPPDQSPTSRLVGELGKCLSDAGWKVAVIADSAAYRGHHARAGSRAVREAKALVRIFGRVLVGRSADVVIAFSSPPCLLLAVAIATTLRGLRLVHWAMDLYPDLALSLREIQEGAGSRLISAAMRWAYHRCVLIVALDADMAAHLAKEYGVASEVLAPWPSAELVEDTTAATSASAKSAGAEIALRAWTWVYSGNLGRAHEWRVLLEVQAELERLDLPIQLLFEGGGAMWPEAQAEAARLQLRHCLWTGYVTEPESFQTVQASRLVVATQRREAQGLLWPSKLARMIPIPKPLLWIGPSDGAIAASIRERARTGCFGPAETKRIADWIEAVFHSGSAESNEIPDAELQHAWRLPLAEGCSRWREWLATVVHTAR